MKKYIVILTVALGAILFTSFIFAGSNNNPPVEATVQWDSAATQETFMRACADCHSHETVWPWYSRFAPISWRVRSHVEEGRKEFNISTADKGEADEAAEELLEGKMPLWDYLLLHPGAKLSDAEKQQFIQGLLATFGGESNDKNDKQEKEDD
jgi:mono/diheme cytochrome c family protein